jgi:hypothetical protein
MTSLKGPVTMDVFLQIHDMPPENVPTITNRVNEIYKPRLQKCPTSKWFPIRTVQKTTLEYVMRFDRVTIDTLRRELRKRLNDCNATKVRIHECHSSGRNAHFAKTLDESPYDRIIELSAPNALPVLTQPVAAAVTTSIRNLPVDGGSVSKHANTRLPPLVSFEPLAGILAAQVVDAAGRNASGDNQVPSRNSEPAEDSVFCFTKPSRTKCQSNAYSNSKMFFVLRLNAVDRELESKLADFKSDLIQVIQEKSYEAFIDAESTPERLHIRIVCSWKTPCYGYSIRRLIHNAILNRLCLEGRIRIFNLPGNSDPASLSDRQAPSGLRWLQHSHAKGVAYTMPMESFVLELGKEVRAHELQLLKCVTLAEVWAHAKRNQVLLSNVYDVLRWRFSAQNQSVSYPVRLQEPKKALAKKEASPDTGHNDSIDSRVTPDALPLTSSQTITEISPSSVAGNPILTPASDAASPAPRRRALQFGGCTVAQTPSGEFALSACGSGAGPAGV